MADHPHNLIRNGSFEHWYADAIPYYWSKTGDPTIAKETSGLDRNNFDNKYAVKITTAAANEGIQVTLSNLKASTTYRVQCRAKAYQAADDAVLDVEGESGTFTAQETNSTGWTTLAGTFDTDNTPTDITIKLSGKASGDIVWFDNVIVTEGSTAYAFAPHPLDNEIVALLSKDLHPNNLVRNGSFEMWSGASGDPPDGWVKFCGSVDEETAQKKLGNRSAKITGGVSGGQLRYEFSNGAEFAGHKVTVRAWVRAGEAGIAKVGIHDAAQHLSDGNTEINTWELLTFTTTVSSGCTTLKVILHVDATKVGYFDGVMFVDSEIPFLFTPHPLDDGGEVYGDLTFKGGKKVKGLPQSAASGEPIVWPLSSVPPAAGKLPKANQAEFDAIVRAYKSGAGQTIANDTYTKVVLESESFDVGNDFASSTFTAPADGYYPIDAALLFVAGVANKQAMAVIYKNGTIYSRAASNFGADHLWAEPSIPDVVYLDENDTIEFWTYQTTGGNCNTHTGSPYVYMSIHRIS